MTSADFPEKTTHCERCRAKSRRLDDGTLLDALLDALENIEKDAASAVAAEDWATLVRQFVDSGLVTSSPHENSKWDVIAHLLARAVFDFGPNPAHLVFAGSRLERAPRDAIDKWLNELVQLIKAGEEESRARWRESLGREPLVPKPLVPTARIHVTRTEADWTIPDSLQLWCEDTAGFLERGLWAPLEALRRWDIDEWFNAIDRWCDPRHVHSALLFVEHALSTNDLLRLLVRARPCFNDVGAPTQAASAVVLCLAIQSAARGLYAESPEGSRRLFERTSTVILERADGVPLALALAADLTDRVVNTCSHVDPHIRAFSDVLLDAIRGRRVSVRMQRDHFNQRCEKPTGRCGGVRRVLPALFVAAKVLDRTRIDDVQVFSAWLVDVLRSDEHWNIWAQSVNALVPAIVTALGEMTQARTHCRSAYSELEGCRRRAQHGHGKPDLDFPNLLLLLVLASLCAVEPADAEGLEADLEFGGSQAFRIGLTSTSRNSIVSPWEVAAIFVAIGCSKFGLYNPRSIALAGPLVRDNQVLGHLLKQLSSIASGAELREWLSELGCSPDEAVNRAETWMAASESMTDRQIAEWTKAALDPPRLVQGSS